MQRRASPRRFGQMGAVGQSIDASGLQPAAEGVRGRASPVTPGWWSRWPSGNQEPPTPVDHVAFLPSQPRPACSGPGLVPAAVPAIRRRHPAQPPAADAPTSGPTDASGHRSAGDSRGPPARSAPLPRLPGARSTHTWISPTAKQAGHLPQQRSSIRLIAWGRPSQVIVELMACASQRCSEAVRKLANLSPAGHGGDTSRSKPSGQVRFPLSEPRPGPPSIVGAAGQLLAGPGLGGLRAHP